MGAVPVYRWRLAPDGLATRRQLRAAGLRPGGQDVAAQIERPRRRRGPLVAYLYRVD
ncbi:RRQRL motif-containing zinc-binding protein, partial [Streptomyces sp. SID7804]